MPDGGPEAVRVLLARTERIEDLRDLFRALGYDAAWEAVPPGPWLGEGAAVGVSAAALVARRAAFRVFGLAADQPAGAAHAAARRLASDGERGMACAVATGGPDLALATWRVGAGGQPGVRCRVFSRQCPSATALAILERITPTPTDTALGLWLRVGDALASEQVTARFFRAFRQTLEQLTDRLTVPRARSERRVLALTALTRVLFLYFVQEKGWLDSDRRFLIRRFDATLAARRSFQHQVLDPLCFGALNRPAGERSAHARALGRIPFLNGGLFEPTALERRAGPASWTNGDWRTAFDELFEHFHFTAHESEDDNRIAPDMLGRVFEGVMEPGARHTSGTFYTPATLVRALVRAGLEAVLVHRFELRRAVAERWIWQGEPPAPAPDLRRLTILDPACGSGAFLLGALHELVALRTTVESGPAIRLRRDVLAHSLLGVDLDPTAVRLTELRLWLALVADDETSDIAALAPLPNLDGLVRQGDALLDPISAAAALSGSPRGSVERAALQQVARTRRALFSAAGMGKRPLLAELARREADVSSRLCDQGLERLEVALGELLAAGRARDLFGGRHRLDADQRRRLRRLRAARRELRAARRRCADGAAPFFAFEAHFAEAMAAGGVDLVVGNPPWVRGERLPAHVRESLAGRYATWRPESRQGWAHLPDLSVAFVERSLELAAPCGVVALLVPAKLATSGYAEPLRRRLAHTTRLERLAPLDHAAAAFGAAVYPMALVAAQRDPEPDAAVATALDGPRSAIELSQHRLQAPGPWVLHPDADRVAHHLRQAFPALGDRWSPQLGVKTGADDVFLVPEPVPGSRPAVRGRDLGPWRARPARHLLWTHDARGRPLAQLPDALAARLRPYEARLRRRADYRDGPPWQLFRPALALAVRRVVWPDLARRIAAVVLPAPIVPLNTVYGVTPGCDTDAHALAAWLNARWLTAIARLGADRARGGYRRFNAAVIRALPVPAASSPVWPRLAALGARMETDDDLVADTLELDADDRRALAYLATHTR